jgi:hypothetical protein
MPIKDQTIYPPYWKQFSLYIREERAKGCCEQCDVPNGYYKVITAVDGERFTEILADLNDVWRQGLGAVVKTTRVVLTVAHLDNSCGVCRCKDETGRKCARPDHVLALCQACHLALDLPRHVENRRAALMAARDAGRTLFQEVTASP